MALQFKVDYNTTTEQPELVVSYDTDATRLDEKLFERFVELLAEPDKTATSSESVLQGVKTVRISISDLPTP
jgi:hypothetical protein